MKQWTTILLTLFVIGFTSCDYTMYMSVRNYNQPCRVNVTYQKSGNTFLDNDTLLLKTVGGSKFDSSLVRVNTSAASYYFIAPFGKEIVLRPVSLGQPITKVEILNSSDSSWSINFRDKKEWMRLKKSGQIKTRGFIFTNAIFIENK